MLRYALLVALLTFFVAAGNKAAASTEPQPLPAETFHQQQTSLHDVAVSYVTLVGPSAVNLSDTNGRYMWVMSQISSQSDHMELIHIALSFADVMASGCTRTASLVLPGQTSMLLSPGEQKMLLWRVRYECHSPAVPQAINQTVTVGITHCDTTTSMPGPISQPTPGGVCDRNSQPSGFETNLANNTASASKPVLVQ